MKTTVVLLLCVFFTLSLPCAKGQKDTLPPPSMMSDRLITISDYTPEAAYGSSYLALTESLKQKKNGRKTIFNRQGSKFILPALFIAYGTAARIDKLPVRQLDFDINSEIRKRVDRHYPIDNYLEFSTPILAFGLDFIPGIKSEHNFRDRTIVMATSYLVMGGMVKGLKQWVPVLRPRGWGEDSFPSGHTAVAMTGAHIMYKEYKGTTPWIGVGGYMIATATGVLRMVNNAHWFSDVVMGAGIGLLSAEIGYMMLPVWHSIFGIDDSRRFAAVPSFSPQGLELGMVYVF